MLPNDIMLFETTKYNKNRISSTLRVWHIPLLGQFLNVPAEEYQLEYKVGMEQRHAINTVLRKC